MPEPASPAPLAPTPGAVRQPAAFGAIDGAGGRDEQPDYLAILCSREFRELRRRSRSFVFPLSVLFLSWYLFYVVTAAYLPRLMSIRVIGEVNLGLVLGLGQFASTILFTLIYAWYARRYLDPRAAALRTAVRSGVPLDVPSRRGPAHEWRGRPK